MMFKLLLLLPIILGPKCLVYSTENNNTTVKLTVDTQPTTISLLTHTPDSLDTQQPAVEQAQPVSPEVNRVKLVDLDIVNFVKNEYVNHRFDKKYNMHMFSCRAGYAFGYVKESFSKHELEYLAKDDLYKSLTQLKKSGKFHLHSDNMVNGAYRWDDTLVLLDLLKKGTLEKKLKEETLFVTVEVDKMESNTHVNYSFDNDNNVHVFSAKRTFIIDSVKLDGEFVWVYDDDNNDGKFPLSVEFSGSDKINLGFQEFFLTLTKKTNGKWKSQKFYYDNETDEGNSSKYVTVDVDKMQDTDDVDYAYDDKENLRVFAAKTPLLINTITKGKEVIWRYDFKKHDGKFPFSVEFNGSDKIEVGFEDFFLTYFKNDQGNWTREKFLYANKDILEDAHESPLAVPEAQVELVPQPEPEPLLDDHLVEALELVWRQNLAALDVEAPEKPVYADYVYVKTKYNEKTVTIFFTDRSVRRFYRVGPLGPWRERVDRPRPITLPPYPRIEYKSLEMLALSESSQKGLIVPKLRAGNLNERKGIILRDRSSSKQTDRRDPKPYGRDFLALMYSQTKKPDGQQAKTPGQGISSQQAGRKGEQEKEPSTSRKNSTASVTSTGQPSGGGTTGTSQPGSRRASAASNSGAANGGSTSRKNSTASVTSTGQSPGGGTTGTSAEPEVVVKEAVTLDIKNHKKPTDLFDYKKDGKVVTYTAKDNYGFNVVKQKNTEIWKTDNPKEYAEKVVMDGKGNNKKTVTIYLPGNKTKVFKKDGRNKPWNEEVQSEGEVTEGSKPKEETSSEQSGTQGTKESSDTSGGGTQSGGAGSGQARTGTSQGGTQGAKPASQPARTGSGSQTTSGGGTQPAKPTSQPTSGSTQPPKSAEGSTATPAAHQGGTSPANHTSGSASAPRTGTQGGSTSGGAQTRTHSGAKPAGGQPARTGTPAQGGTACGQAKPAGQPANQASASQGARSASTPSSRTTNQQAGISSPTSGGSTTPASPTSGGAQARAQGPGSSGQSARTSGGQNARTGTVTPPSSGQSRPASSTTANQQPGQTASTPASRTQGGSTGTGQARTGSGQGGSQPTSPTSGSDSTPKPGTRTGGTSGGSQAAKQADGSSPTSGGAQPKTQSGGQPSGGQQARTGSTPAARTTNQASAGQGTGSASTPAARTTNQQSGGSSANPGKPAGQQGAGSGSGRAAITAGQGGGQSTPKPQTGSSGARQSNSHQQAKPTTPPAGGSSGTGTSDDSDISVTIGAQETTILTSVTRTSTFTSSGFSSSGASSGGITLQIPD